MRWICGWCKKFVRNDGKKCKCGSKYMTFPHRHDGKEINYRRKKAREYLVPRKKKENGAKFIYCSKCRRKNK